MRARGISYDTGFVHLGVSTHEPFDPDFVRRDLDMIRDELHCTAVRLTGGDPDRLELGARHAADLGLEVWISPFTTDLSQDDLVALLADLAGHAERLRRGGAEVVLVTGAELSLFTPGFFPGDTLEQRLALLADPPRLRAAMADVPPPINAFLARAAAAVRARFGGKLAYASIWYERVDWTPFDYVGLDAYRTADLGDRYAEGLRALVAQGKPVAITEFGSATFRGAPDLGARAMEIVEYDGPHATRIKGEHTRDEPAQAAHLRDTIALLDALGVDTVFVYTFANFHLPHRPDPALDLDLASYGVVKVLDDNTRVPKLAFAAVAEAYAP